jgi:hypothetical protein
MTALHMRLVRGWRAASLLGLTGLALAVVCYFVLARLDRGVKTLAQLDPHEVLERLASLPIYRWRYRFQPTVPHIGGMAQDFYARFGVGDSPRRIYLVDAIGIAYAAIIALHEQLGALSAEWKRAWPLIEQLAAQQAAIHQEGEL